MIRAAWISCAVLAGCAGAEPVAETTQFAPQYRGVETSLLDDDLVQFRVRMSGARSSADVNAYATCAAAQYAMIRGYGFARHLRTKMFEEGGVWGADAVYTISPTLPPGLQTIDAEVAVADCAENGIPTV